MNSGSAFAAPPDYFFEHLFNFNLQGGSNLYLQGNGSYSVDLIFNLYNASNVLISSKTMTAIFQYNYTGANLFDKCSDVTLNGQITSPLTQYTTYNQLMSGSTVSSGGKRYLQSGYLKHELPGLEPSCACAEPYVCQWQQQFSGIAGGFAF